MITWYNRQSKFWRPQRFIKNFKLYIKECIILFEVLKIKCKNFRVAKTNKGKLVLLGKCAAYDGTSLKFMKKQESRGLFSNLGILTPLGNSAIRGYFVLKI